MPKTVNQSDTPRTDAVHAQINERVSSHAEDVCDAMEHARHLERENATLRIAANALLAVPEVRKAAVNWASDELIALRSAL